MKLVRYSVQDHANGYAVWDICPDYYRSGWCQFEGLLCTCYRPSGVPLRQVVSIWPTLALAIRVADRLEVEYGGVRSVPDCVDEAHRSGPVPADTFDPDDIPY